MPTFQDFFEQNAFLAFEKQARLVSLIGQDHEWLLDTEKATVTFNGELVFPVQYLGTESEITNTWLWADANEKVPFPKPSLQYCQRVRGIGREHGLDEFVSDHFELVDEVGKATGHTLSMVATCFAGASCYYRGPHENGAVYFALVDPRIDAIPDLDRTAFVEAFNGLLWLPGNMKNMISSYLSAKGYKSENGDGSKLTFRLYTGESVSMSFKPTQDGGTNIRLLTKVK